MDEILAPQTSRSIWIGFCVPLARKRTTMKAILISVILCSVIASGCATDSPATPTPPAPAMASVAGSVTVTGGARVAGAIVEVFDGPNAGRSTTTNASGAYVLDNLTPGNANVTANATIYDEVVIGANLTGATTMNFVFAIPACQTANTASIGFGNRSITMTQTIIWDGLTYVTLTPGQTSNPLVASAGVAHTLQFQIANSNDLACTDSTPVLTQCERGRVITCS